jgi:uncharacterized integral membrane protein
MANEPIPGHRTRDPRWISYLRLGGLAVAAILVIVFITENSASVVMHLFGAKFTAPLWLMLLIVAVLGALIGWLVTWQRMRARH